MTVPHSSQAGPILYTTEEAAEILRVKKSWLERQAAARKIPFTMLGRSYRFTSVHLAAIVRMHEEVPAPSARLGDRDTRSQRRAAEPRGTIGGSAPLRPRPRKGPHRAA
jgi:excisionase family DNA binding protein